MITNIQKFFGKARKYISTNILFITFIITSVINGILVRGATVGTPLDIKPLLADLVLVMVLGAFAYFIKPKYRYIYFILMSILLSGICMINAIYYKNYLSFASI